MDAYVFFLSFVTRHVELWQVRILSVATSAYSIGKVLLISSCLTEVSRCSKCCQKSITRSLHLGLGRVLCLSRVRYF